MFPDNFLLRLDFVAIFALTSKDAMQAIIFSMHRGRPLLTLLNLTGLLMPRRQYA